MRKLLLSMISAIMVATLPMGASADGEGFLDNVVNTTSRGFAMDGFDVIAYHTDKAPAKGEQQFSHVYKGREWLFSSAENRDLFVSNPTKYEPRNNGWCAWAVANGYAAEVDFLEGWFFVEDELYLTWSAEVRDRFLSKKDEMLPLNKENWSSVHAGLKDGSTKFFSHSMRPHLGFVHPQQIPEES